MGKRPDRREPFVVRLYVADREATAVRASANLQALCPEVIPRGGVRRVELLHDRRPVGLNGLGGYASHMANGIAPIQRVSSQLGHRRTSMTRDVYVHPMAPERSYISALEHARQAVHGTSPGTYPQAGRQPIENMSLASAGTSSADRGPGPA